MIEVNIGLIVLGIFIINSILDQLINWWFRKWANEDEGVLPIIIYILKLIAILALIEGYWF